MLSDVRQLLRADEIILVPGKPARIVRSPMCGARWGRAVRVGEYLPA
ncbi:hypothetical protein AB0E62_23215 [Streptomyces sp. NPDC038707]